MDVARRLARGVPGDGEVCDTCAPRIAGLCRPPEAEQLPLGPRDILFHEGDHAGHVFTLVQGTAQLTRLLPDGRERVLGFRFDGDVVGYTASGHCPFAAQLLTTAAACRLERYRLDTIPPRYPAPERRLLDLCVQELAATQDQLVTAGRRTGEARVAAFLLSLAEAGWRRSQPGSVLAMPMTRSDIADFPGLTLETVSRTLTAFRRRGWVREPAHGRIELLRRDALSELTDGIAEA